MYKRILLAYDGSLEGRTALKEGALLARICRAKVFLLSVVPETPGVRIAEGAFAGAVAHEQQIFGEIFDEGLQRLRQLGLEPEGKVVSGEPAGEISAYAREVGADLVVVGHRKQNLLARWWSGSTGAYLVDNIGCSLLIARNVLSDAAIHEQLAAAQPA